VLLCDACCGEGAACGVEAQSEMLA
jgi:hypothetical protein